jgi:hypothetical protein
MNPKVRMISPSSAFKEGIVSAIQSIMKNEINIKMDFNTRIAPAILDDISGLSLYTEICRAAE